MRFWTVVAACLFLAFSGILYGQAVTGSMLGTVTDATNAVVPGAKVTITAVNTGITRNAETNLSGNYSFPALEPGSYRVSIEHTGFRTFVREGVDLLVNTTVRVDVVLQPGLVNETVNVTAESALLQTDRSDTGRKIESVQVVNLPLGYNRSFQGLLNLVPGTTRAFQPHSEFFNSQGSLSTQVNGVSRLGNNVQLEGVDNNHRTGLLSILIPPIEALETVDVSTSNYEAELGRAGGAVTNVMLKSGTNEVHGSAYWSHTDSALGARDTFQPTKPVTTYNYYGFNLGGPIRKNRTFVFGDFLQIKDRRGDGYIITVPTTPARLGDFSSQASRAVIYDPTTGNPASGAGRQPFANNQIPDARISPIARKLLAMVPQPNNGSGLTNNYAGATTRKKDYDSFDVKVDHQQTDSNRFSARYSFQRPVVTDPGRFGIAGGGGKGFAATGVNRTQSAGVNYTHLFSNTLITEARVGMGRYSNKAQNLDYGSKAAETVGIKGANLDDWSSGLTSINLNFSNPLVGYANSLPWNRAETNIDFVNNWTKIFHNHTIKFGVDLRRVRDDLLQTQDAGGPRGEFQFRANQTSTPGAPVVEQVNNVASFLLDTPSLMQRDLAVIFPTYRAVMLFTYLQDKWQVSPKLTLDLGLRHDYYPPATPRLPGGFSNYDWNTNTLVVAGYGNNPMNLGRKTYYKNFAPRLGLAYRMNNKTVIRSGFGISWIPFPDNKYAFDNFPVKQSIAYNAPNTYAQAQVAPGVNASMASGFPAPQPAVIPTNGLIQAGTPALLAQSISSAVALDYHEGYIESWNFALQRQLPKNFVLDIAYVGNHTVRAPATYNLNASMTFNTGSAGRPLYQKFGKSTDVNYRYLGLSNNYNALQVKFDRRFSGGFALTTAYTFAKALGYSSEDGDFWNYIQPHRAYGPLNFDRRHVFTQSYVYELPFGRNKPFMKTGPARWIFGDWQVSGIMSAMTGRPMTLDTTVSANTPGSSITPDMIGDFKVTHGVAGPGGSETWFDTSAFKQPLDADGKTPHFGNVGRNSLSGPGMFDLDLSLFRKFQFGDRWKAEFRAETLNLTNTPMFGQPSTKLGNPDFGKITGTSAGLIANQSYGGTGPRGITLALRIRF